MAQAREQSFLRDLVAGSLSASLGKTVIAPVERVKLLLQLQDASEQLTKETRYLGIRNCVSRVLKEQGVISFWRGNFVNVCRYFPTVAFSFATKDWFKRMFCANNPEANYTKFILGNIAAGGFAGAAATILSYPLDFGRTRLAADVGRSQEERQFTGFWDCMRKVIRTEGISGVYRGVFLALPIFVFYRAFYFGIYDTWTYSLRQKGELPIWGMLLVANSITAVGSLTIYPLDTIRRRLMMQSGRKDALYTGVVDCARKIYHNEGGFAGFYKGGLTNLFRSAGGALVLVLYDKLKEVLR